MKVIEFFVRIVVCIIWCWVFLIVQLVCILLWDWTPYDRWIDTMEHDILKIPEPQNHKNKEL